HVDAGDARVRVGAADEGEVQFARDDDVVGVLALARQQRRVFAPRQRRAHHAGAVLGDRHAGTPALAAASTALTMLWYPVQRHRLPSRPRRTSSSVRSLFSLMSDTAASTMPGVQKPHCRPWCCWNAACTGWSPSPVASPSMVVMRRSRAWAASMVQDFTLSPSTSTVQAPHEDVSQPTLVPVRPTTRRM